jgi:hypothetical protein
VTCNTVFTMLFYWSFHKIMALIQGILGGEWCLLVFSCLLEEAGKT